MLFFITIDIVILIFSILAVIITSMIVFRTEHGLDRAFKYYLGTAITLLVASVMVLDSYINIIPLKYTIPILQISRVAALILFILGSQVMLMIVSKTSKK